MDMESIREGELGILVIGRRVKLMEGEKLAIGMERSIQELLLKGCLQVEVKFSKSFFFV